MKQEIVKAAKAKQPSGQLYCGEISFVDEEAKSQDIEFVYRRPQVVDIEMFQRQVAKSPLDAQANLLLGLIVEPDAREIVDKLRPYPFVVSSFVDTEIAPFFGSQVATKSKKI